MQCVVYLGMQFVILSERLSERSNLPRYPDIGEGWVPVPKRGFRLKCCDCSLIHTIDFRINSRGQVEIRVDRHERATKAARRGLNRRFVDVDEQ